MAFADKVVVITGASSGIGRATAIQMAELGAKLTITGRNEIKLALVADECEGVSNVKPLIVVAEMAEEMEVQLIIDETLQTYGAIHVLINNAATMELGAMGSSSLRQYDNVFNVNVRAAYQLTTLAIPHLIKTKGNIVNVSSINSLRAYPYTIAYNMSKAALDQMTKCLAVELAYQGVRVNSVNPGLVKTEFMKRDDVVFTQAIEYGKKTQPLGRIGEADEVARAIVFLAHKDSFFINGVLLPVDGGKLHT